MKRKTFAVMACVLAFSGAANATDLTMNEAVAKALATAPSLKAAEADKQAKAGEVRQAGTWQNPELSVNVDNFAGKGSVSGFKAAETTYGVSQLIEIGGKRSAREAEAQGGLNLAGHDLQATRLDLIRDVEQTYVAALASAESVKLAREQQKLADDMLASVTKRVDAAREPLIQKSKANVAIASSRIALDKAEREYDVALRALAFLIGEDQQAPIRLSDASFYKLDEPALWEDLRKKLERNPDIARKEAERTRSEAAYDLERANAIPDPRLSFGVREFRENRERAFVAGLSIPIPVLNGNRGNIDKARAELTKTVANNEALRQRAEIDLTNSTQAQKAAYTQAATLREYMLPEADKAFALARQGYLSGKSSYLDVLDAQRTLTETRQQYVDALKDYHLQRAEVERLTAAHLYELTAKE